jgi:acyl dehydratase
VEIDSRFVGTKLRSRETVLHWRDMMNYAAGVDDRNPIYYDDETGSGVVGHPLFPIALSWPMLRDLPETLEEPHFPVDALATQAHDGEHLILQRLLRAGERVAIDAEIAAIVPHPAGTRLVIRLTGADDQDGPVFTRHCSTLLRGVHCKDGGAGAENVPSAPAAREHSEILWQAVVPIGPLRPYLYDGCSGISRPYHLSRRSARKLELPGIVLQETATLALALRELLYREADGEPQGLRTLSCSFTGIVLPGTEIRIQLVGRTARGEGTGLHFVVLNHQDHRAISDGYAYIRGRG